MNSIDFLLVTPELKIGSVKQKSPKLYDLLSSTGSLSPLNRAKGARKPGPLTLPAPAQRPLHAQDGHRMAGELWKPSLPFLKHEIR